MEAQGTEVCWVVSHRGTTMQMQMQMHGDDCTGNGTMMAR